MTISSNDLKTFLAYDPDTGQLRYRVNRQGGAKQGDPAGVLQPNGYKTIMIKRKRYYLHQLVWLYHHNEIPSRLQFLDGQRHNTRIENLHV